jgi:AraC-like DNA-binding protein
VVLKKRDASVFGTGRGKPRPRRTLLGPAALAERCQQSHVTSSSDLAPYAPVAWTLRWQFGEDEAHVQHVLPDPCVQIVVEAGGAHVMGVVTRLFSVTLTDARFVLGLKFRPGGFRPFMSEPVSTLTNRTVPLATMFPDVDEQRLRDFAAAADGQRVMDALESLLRKAAPAPDPQFETVSRMTDRIATDSTILAVEHAARVFGIRLRSLQRLFRAYVGVGPKWIIRLYRIKEAAARIEDGNVSTWADLALRLGYADQAHFVNDFRRIVGRSPARYADAVNRSGASRVPSQSRSRSVQR